MSQGTMVAGGGPRAPPRSCEVPPRDVGGARATTRGGRGRARDGEEREDDRPHDDVGERTSGRR